MVPYQIVYLMGYNINKDTTIGNVRKLPQETLTVSNASHVENALPCKVDIMGHVPQILLKIKTLT